MRTPAPPARVAAVAHQLSLGRSTRDVAGDFGISEGTVRNWKLAHDEAQRREAVEALAPRGAGKPPGGRFSGVQPLRYGDETKPSRLEQMQQAADERAAEPAPDEDDNRDTLTEVKQMLRDSLRQAKDAGKIGHAADAQRFGRIAAVLVPVIARLERDQKTDEHVLRISRQEIAERRIKVRQRFRAICDRPLLCAQCNRKLSVFWGTGKSEEELSSA